MAQFKDVIAQRLAQSRREISEQWLAHLSELVPVEDREIFPSETLLDHIPLILEEVARFLQAPGVAELSVSSSVIAKAQELGRLRFEQSASLHQILREYDALATILEGFVVEEGESRRAEFPLHECVDTMARLNRAVRMLMQTTADTFAAAYTAKIEEQQQRLIDFNRTLSHELRGPMNTLRIATTLLESASDPSREEQTKVAHLVRSGVDRSQKILEELEALSGTRVDENTSLTSQQVDLTTVLQAAVKPLEEMAAAREVELRVQEGMPETTVDVGKLELAVANLVANAIKYSDRAKPERFVEVGANSEDDSVTISVRDNGLGIPESAQAQIFDRSFRAHAESDGELGVDGSGLGLVIVKECVGDMKGRIGFESIEGKGSHFWIRLPR